MFKIKLAILTTVIMLGGCASLEPRYQRPELPSPQMFSLTNNTLVEQTGNLSSSWRTFFVDPQLKQVIELALAHNRDLQTAMLKVEEAAQQYNVTNADRYPQLSASSDATYSGGLKSQTSATHQYNIAAGISYEIDFFGKLKNMSEVERQSFMASQAAQRAAYILVISQVSQNYLNHALIEQQLAIAKKSLSNYQRSYQLLEQRHRAGESSLLDLAQAHSLIETAQQDIAKKQGDLAQSRHILQLLTGTYDLSVFNALEMNTVKLSVTLPKDLSSDILLQRPDIVEAEHQLIAANANIGIARAAFFPSISLTGDLTNANTDLSALFNAASGIWRFIPKIDVPLFNAGKNKSNLSLAEIRKDISIANYEQKIQTAFKEVSDALSLRDALQQQIATQERYLRSQRLISQRANLLYSNGSTNYLNILDAERALFLAQQNLAELKYNLHVNEINLFVALGGGWAE